MIPSGEMRVIRVFRISGFMCREVMWVVMRHLDEVGVALQVALHYGCIVAGGEGLTESSEEDILQLSQKETRIKHTYLIYRHTHTHTFFAKAKARQPY